MRNKVLLMALAMASILTACGGKAEGKGSGADEPVMEETETGNDAEAKEDPSSEPEAAPEDVGKETQEDAKGEGKESDGYVKGIVTEDGWESEFLGMRYTVPEGMGMATEEALNDMMGLGEEVLSQDLNELQIKYAQMKTCYEMMSANAENTVNVLISVEKLPLMNMEAKEYLEAVERNLSTLSAVSYDVLSDDEVADIAGREFAKLSCAADYQGVSMYQDYYVCVVGNRAVAIAVTYIEDTVDMAETIIDAFTVY